MAREKKKTGLKPEYREQFGYVNSKGDLCAYNTIEELIEHCETPNNELEIVRYVATEIIKVKKQAYAEVSRSKIK